MSDHVTGGQSSGPQRISGRAVTARTLGAGLDVPAAGLIGAAGAAAQSTPQTAAGRTVINPGEMFSGAIVANGIVFTSGMLATDSETRELVGDDITSQTEQVLANLEAVLTAAGSSMDKIVKAACFLASLDDFQAFNEVHRQAFTSEPPARSTVEVAALALGALVEIDFVAIIQVDILPG